MFETQRANLGFGPRVEVQTHSLVVNIGGPSPQPLAQQSTGWQFLREAGPGAIVEAFVLTPEGIVYENVEYVRWGEFWSRASQMILPLVELSAKVTDIKLFSIEYFDRFVFSGNPDTASPTPLISEGLISSLPDSIKTGQELWHIHRGWYESTNGVRVLINQNLDANDGQNLQNEPKRSIGLYTKVERRNKEEIVNSELLGEDMQKMHVISKSVVANALTPEFRARIGLHGDA